MFNTEACILRPDALAQQELVATGVSYRLTCTVTLCSACGPRNAEAEQHSSRKYHIQDTHRMTSCLALVVKLDTFSFRFLKGRSKDKFEGKFKGKSLGGYTCSCLGRMALVRIATARSVVHMRICCEARTRQHTLQAFCEARPRPHTLFSSAFPVRSTEVSHLHTCCAAIVS